MTKQKNKLLFFSSIILIILGLTMVAISAWNTNLNDALTHYYKLDELSGNVIDSAGGMNATFISGGNSIRGVPGIIGTAYNFSGDGYVNFTTPSNDCVDANCTINLWVNVSTSTGQWLYYNGVIDGANGLNYSGLLSSVNIAGDLCYGSRNTTSGEIFTCSGFPLNNQKWNMITIVRNTTFGTLYINGTYITKFQDLASFTGSMLQVNRREYLAGKAQSSGAVGDFPNVVLDEMGLWNRSLNATEVAQLYNNRVGITFVSSAGSTTLISPLNNSYLPNSNVTFNATISTLGTLINATLYLQNNSGAIVNQSSNITLTGLSSNIGFNVGNLSFAQIYHWNVLGCSTSGCNYAPKNFTFRLVNITESFSPTLIEGQGASLNMNLTFVNIPTSVQASVKWNNTYYPVSKAVSGTDVVTFSSNFVVPAGTGSSTGNSVSHFWRYWLPDNSVNDTTLAQNQTVFKIGLDDCTSNNILVLNYTAKDEDSLAILSGNANNVTIDVDLRLYTLGTISQVDSFNRTFSVVNGTNPARVCIRPEVLNGTSFRMDVTARYTSANRALEFNNIQNFTLNNNTIPQKIDLYDLLTTRDQQFLITVKDSNFIPLSDAVIEMSRQYLGLGNYLLIESPKTDQDGRTVGNFVLNDEVYTLFVRKNNQLLGTFNNVRAFCSNIATGDCRITLNIAGTSIQPTSFQTVANVSFYPTYNTTTQIYTLNFVTTDGSVKTISLNGTIFDNYQNTTACSNVLSSSSGVLTCSIPFGYENATVIMKGYVDSTQLFTDIFPIHESHSDEFNPTRYLLAFILIVCLPLIALTSGVGVIIFYIVGLIMAGLFALVDQGGFIGIGSAFLWFIIGSILLLWKLNSKKEDG